MRINLIGILILTIFINAYFHNVYALTYEEIQSQLNDLNNKVKVFEIKRDELTREILNKRNEAQSLKNNIDFTNYQIEKLQNDINILDLNISRKGLEIEEKQLNVEDTSRKIAEVKFQIGNILNASQAINKSLIYIIFSSINISDFSSKMDLLKNINDTLIFNVNSLKDLRNQNLINKTALESDRTELLNLKSEKENKKFALGLQKDSQNLVYLETKGQEMAYQTKLIGIEQERIKIMNQILALEEESKRLRNFKYYLSGGLIPSQGTKIFKWPVVGAILTQGYGITEFSRRGYYGGKIHNGIDIASDLSSQVFAAAQGKVIGKNSSQCPNFRDYGCQGGWGNWVAIEHHGKIVTLYAHMIKMSFVNIGDDVDVNTIIGYQGASGNVTGSHLHFSVYTEFYITEKGWPGYNPEGTVNPLWYL